MSIAAADEDLREFLGGWQDLLDGLVIDIACFDDETSVADWAATAAAQLRAADWLRLPTVPDVPFALIGRCVERLHQRVVPLPLPILEQWLAISALNDVDSADARQVLDEVLAGDRQVVMPVGCAFPTEGRPRPVLLPALGRPDLVTISTDGDIVELVLVERPEVEEVDLDPTLRSARWAPRVGDRRTSLGPLPPDRLARLQSSALVMQSAALAGQSSALFGETVAYLSSRKQFGKLIGQFQALRHLAADLQVQLLGGQLALDYVLSGAEAAEHPWPSMAKATCGQLGLRIGSEAIQIHGGFGFTWEAGLHFGVRRCLYHASSGPSIDSCYAALGRVALDSASLTWPDEH